MSERHAQGAARPPHRRRIVPLPLLTGRGFAILACAALIPLLGIASGVEFETQAGLTVCFVAICGLWVFAEFLRVCLTLRTLQVQFEPPATLYSNGESLIRITIHCPGWKKGWLALRPEIPRGVIPLEPVHRLALPAASEALTYEYSVRIPGRGRVCWEIIDARVCFAPKLLCWQFKWRCPEPVVRTVYPDNRSRDVHTLQAFQKLFTGEKVFASAGEGREFDSLRAYAVGDDLRRIDWKRSASGSRLLVRCYRPETHQRVTIAIDCGRRMGNRIGDRLQLDYAADAAAQLMRLAGEQEDESGLFAFDHQVIAKLPCAKGIRHERRMLAALVGLQAGALEADYQLLTEWAHFHRKRSLLVLITSVASPVALDRLRAALLPVRGKHLPLICALADQDLENLAEERAFNPSQAYVIAAAMEQLAQIQGRVQALQHAGIDCVYTRAAGLPEALRRKYFELKLSGRL